LRGRKRTPEPVGPGCIARVVELAACCASFGPCFPGLARCETGHIHPWNWFVMLLLFSLPLLDFLDF
jgi:hypothetical protein